jgi:transcriptional regulator with XRE-family HTH domain
LARTSLSLPFDGMRLRHWRERAGLTQQRLAHACGLSRYQISRWETGDSKPAPGSLKPLVDGLTRALTDAENTTAFGLADLLDDQPRT